MTRTAKSISISRRSFEALRSSGEAPLRGQRSLFSRYIARTLDLFESDSAARDAFLARIDTRVLPVSDEAADAVACATQRLSFKVRGKGALTGLSQRLIDDTIDRMLDKAGAP